MWLWMRTQTAIPGDPPIFRFYDNVYGVRVVGFLTGLVVIMVYFDILKGDMDRAFFKRALPLLLKEEEKFLSKLACA